MNPEDASSIVESLYEEWYSRLVSYALRARTEAANVAEDAVQEAFLALYSELVSGGSVHSPKGWMHCVVRREVIKTHRDELRQRDLYSAMSGFSAMAPAYDPAHPQMEIEGLLSCLTRREAEIGRAT